MVSLLESVSGLLESGAGTRIQGSMHFLYQWC